MKKIVKGNDFIMRIPVMKIVDGEKQAFPLPACTDIVVRLCSAFRRYELTYTIDAKDDNVLLARVEGDKIPCGSYALEVRGKIFGNDWRSNEYEQLVIVDNNEKADTEFGKTDEGENSVEMDTAVVYLPPSAELSGLITEAQETVKTVTALNEQVTVSEEERAKSEESRVQAELTRASNEAERVQAEQVRESAENARADAENTRVEAEAVRATAESERVTAENARTEAEAARQEAEKTRTRTEEEREANELTRKNNEVKRQDNETARQIAEGKREEVTSKAVADCEEASTGAGNVNAVLNGNVLTVTDRQGAAKSVNLTDSDEHVTVNVTTDVKDASVAGIKLSVYINDAQDYHLYTTDSNGQAEFTVTKGSTYKVAFPYVTGCDPIDPVRHVAAVGNRIIDAHYKEETDKKEHVTAIVKKADETNDTPQPWEGVNVYLTIGKDKTTYVTDAQGKAEFDVESGTAYTVSVDEIAGMYEQKNLTEVSRTASSSDFRFNCVFRAYESGVFLIDDDNKQWTFADWEASGNDNARLSFVSIKTKETQQYKGDVYVSIDTIANIGEVPKKEWGSTNYAYTSVPLNGDDKGSPGYYVYAYNGLYCTQCIVNEAGEQGRTDIAFATYCHAQTIEQGGKTWQGYGPTLWQWRLFWQNVSMILEAVSKKHPESNVGMGDIGVRAWSITQSSQTNAWCIGSKAIVTSKEKYTNYAAIPFFSPVSK